MMDGALMGLGPEFVVIGRKQANASHWTYVQPWQHDLIQAAVGMGSLVTTQKRHETKAGEWLLMGKRAKPREEKQWRMK